MIDLSFEYGMLPGDLARRLPEADFTLLQVYAAKKMLPSRRIEMYLAQLTSVLAQVNGGECTTSDFLLDPEEESTVESVSAEEAQQAFGFSPYKKGAA